MNLSDVVLTQIMDRLDRITAEVQDIYRLLAESCGEMTSVPSIPPPKLGRRPLPRDRILAIVHSHKGQGKIEDYVNACLRDGIPITGRTMRTIIQQAVEAGTMRWVGKGRYVPVDIASG